jgi:3-hydroxybutyryl-CoA dehydratase
MNIKNIEMSFEVGHIVTFSKTIAEFDIYQFAGITGDFNPVHINEVYAQSTKFGKRIAHGMLTSSFICTALGTQMPGVGTIHVNQNLNFIKPVYIGDTITVRLELLEKNTDKKIWVIKSDIYNQHEELVVEGTSTVKPPKL